jgi:RHS repeat-associated protein
VSAGPTITGFSPNIAPASTAVTISVTRVRKQAAMRTVFALAIAISLMLALVAPAAAAVGMAWPYLCNYWPGHVDCGTLSSTPTTSVCFGEWIALDADYGTCGGVEPGANDAPGPTAAAGQDVPAADPIDLSTGIFMLRKVDAAFPGVVAVAFERTYRSGDTFPGPFGLGTTLEYEDFIQPTSSTIITYFYRGNARTTFTKQADGTFTAATIPAFRGTTITVNGDGTRTMRRKDGSTIVFNTQGLQISRSDRFGNTVTIGRAPNTAPSTITSPSGRSLSLTWVGTLPRLRVSQVTDSTGRSVHYDYDASERLVAVTDLAGGVTQYGYDSQHRMTTITDARSITFLTNTYDVNSRVCRQQQADGGIFTLYYVTADIASSPDTIQLLQQGESGGPVTQTPCTGPASSSPVVATVIVDPRGHPTTHRFNASGLVTKTTDALAQATTYNRDAATNLITSTTDPLGRQTSYTYDAAGNVTSVTRLAGTSDAVTTNFTYDPTFNQMTSVTDPLGPGHSTTFAYDAQGRLTGITNALSRTITVTPGPTGQPVAIADPLGNTTQFGYTAGDLVSITDPMGKVTTRSLDSAGRLSTLTNPLGHRTSYAYDNLNHVTGITDAQNGLTQFTYDANGNLRSVRDARGSVTGYTPDNMDRVATRTDPLTRSESSTYDLAGNLVSFTDRKGQVTNRTYDALDRLAQVTYVADGSTISYTWDAGNALRQITDSQSGTITRTYDLLDRLTQETTPQGSISYTYDAAGRRTSMTVAGQAAVTYGYDNANRLLTITQGSNVVTIAYDDAGRRTSVTLPNGVVTEYAYDAASRVTGLTYRRNTTTLGTLTYTYDAAGNRVQVGGTWARTALPPALDPASYDAANRPLTFGGQVLAHDFNGNLLSDGTSGYTWDVRNRLTGITGPVPATFQYDATGRRTRKTINGVATDFVHDGINPVTESSASGTGLLLTSLGIDDFLMRIGPATSMFLTDALGSLVATTDAAGGVQSELTYEPFGNTEMSSPAPAYRFTGREHDEPLYLYYYRARYYHTDLQRFTSEDPIEFAGGDVNLYGYVTNNPLTFIDPLGLDKECADADLKNSTPLQSLLDVSAGFGDGVSLHATELIRRAAGIDGTVRKNCGLYRAAEAIGFGWLIAINAVGAYTGHEFKFGRDWRVAPWGNRTGDPYGELPHYHRRGAPGPDGKTPPGQGIGRHRPWE